MFYALANLICYVINLLATNALYFNMAKILLYGKEFDSEKIKQYTRKKGSLKTLWAKNEILVTKMFSILLETRKFSSAVAFNFHTT